MSNSPYALMVLVINYMCGIYYIVSRIKRVYLGSFLTPMKARYIYLYFLMDQHADSRL